MLFVFRLMRSGLRLKWGWERPGNGRLVGGSTVKTQRWVRTRQSQSYVWEWYSDFLSFFTCFLLASSHSEHSPWICTLMSSLLLTLKRRIVYCVLIKGCALSIFINLMTTVLICSIVALAVIANCIDRTKHGHSFSIVWFPCMWLFSLCCSMSFKDLLL